MQKLIFFLLIATVSSSVQAQHSPFWDEIAAFQKADSLNPPPEHPIVFTGSSIFSKMDRRAGSLSRLSDHQQGIRRLHAPDVNRYTEQVIVKYDPRQIVIYCGDNDLARL